MVIEGKARDLGGFTVRRVLPSMQRRMVGPFIFFDHMGPVEFPAGQGIDVRPHPHIGLATITYLFEGVFCHKDSTGSDQVIVPGDVNWMIAGRGIVHSERTPADLRKSPIRLHGVQTWVALPLDHEETEPRFEHHPGRTIPVVTRPGAELAVVAGHAYGVTAPTGVLSETLYVAAKLEGGAHLEVDEAHPERAVYVAAGS
ncbi:MAG: pirin family protein, partial [Myxococcales bacterium]|nr:pirin family protein [Myxococcales bacterium]